MQGWTYTAIAALAWSLAPLFAFGLAGDSIVRACGRLPIGVRLVLPVLFGVPYALAGIAPASGRWLAFYFSVPVLLAVLLWHAKQSDPEQRGDWRDFAILLILGMAVDLRWLDPAWPAHLSVIGKLILLDSGLYGFLVIRQLSDVGFDLRIRGGDIGVALRELLFYAPLALLLGLALEFLHLHAGLPRPGTAGLTVLGTFFLIAIPEEIYFRGWMQNLLERRLGRMGSLFLTSAIFGLSHFNKRTVNFNWRYVLLAAIAGVFYGRAWRQGHRVAASAITHASVDTIWSLWLR
ncbi:MAG: CPBP family intramembrane glutamic endopeptidase [Terriglobales bacterium]